MAEVDPKRLTTVDALAQLSFLIHGTLGRRAAEEDLSMIQTRLLGVLRDRQPTMNELATLLALDKSSVSGLIDRAERRGLVRRTASPSDGRATHVVLTRKGRAVVTRVADRFSSDIHTLLDGLDRAERAALTTLSSRVVAAGDA